MTTKQSWSSAGYREHAGFVPAYGGALLDLLDPRPGERVLDLGCGDGKLTAQIAARGADVLGIDSAPDLLAAARRENLRVELMDGQALTFAGEFDAVFSNAALHWMLDPDAVLRGVRRALKPDGRFVAELGGHGCVAAVVVALRAVLAARGLQPEPLWYFPTDDDYRRRLEAHGFRVEQIELFPRLTPLPTGLEGWLATFARPYLDAAGPSQRGAVERSVVELLRPVLCDERGRWTLDYVRLRFVARLPG